MAILPDELWDLIYLHLDHLEKRMMACAVQKFACSRYNVKNKEGEWFRNRKTRDRTVELAALTGTLAQILWCKEAGYEVTTTVLELMCWRFTVAEIKYCLENDFPIKYSWCSLHAALGANFEVYKFLYSRSDEVRCYMACVSAAAKNDFGMLKWLHKNPGHQEPEQALFGYFEIASEAAAKNEHFAMLKYLQKKKYLFNRKTLEAAQKTGNKQIVDWLVNRTECLSPDRR